MFGFTKKNVEISQSDRIKKVEHRLTMIEAEILDIATAQNIIRNKVLKKIQFKNPKEEEETEDLYNNILIKEK